MLRAFRSRLTYANVVASLALFIALGGVSYAAIKLPKNSVGASQIKKNAISGSKVKNSALTGSDIKDKSLTASDFSGPVQGPQGAAGPAGAKGDTGAPGPAVSNDAYTAQAPGFPLLVVTTSFSSVVTTPTMPAGSYTLAARANILGGGGVKNTLICSLANDAAQNFSVVSGDVFPLSMASTTTLGAPGTVALSCNKSAGSPQVAQATIIATRVATLTGG